MRFEPLSPSYLADPYATLAEARAEAAVAYAPDIDMWVVTRMADVEAVFMDPETFSASIAQDPLMPVCDEAKAVLAQGFNPLRTLSNASPEMHRRTRPQAQKGFSNRRMALMETVVRERAAGFVVDFLASGSSASGDLVAGVAFPLPAVTIFRLIGFPPEDTEQIKAWAGDRLAFSWGKPTAEQQTAIARQMLAYWRYCQDFVTKRFDEPGDDFTTDLIAEHRADPEGLSLDEIRSIIYGLSFAGHETTTNLISNTLRNLLADRAQWATVCANPALAARAVEETLRFDTSVITWRRLTTRPVTIDGVEVPEGARLLLLLGGANRDPARFPEPDSFDISRANSRQHVSFGKGAHYCLGAQLARMEAKAVIEELARRVPQVTLQPDQSYAVHPNVTFRGPQQLWLSW